MKQRFTKGRISRDEQGLAAFIIVFMLMVVITLIVTGYSQIVRRNAQQALDRNLSARAFYVAESGVNMAAQVLKTNPYGVGGKTDCAADANFNYTIDTDAEISCLTIDTAPTNLEFSNIPANGKSQVIPITANGTINQLEFSWQSTKKATSLPCAAGTKALPPNDGTSWNCNAPLLRVDIVQTGAGINMNNLANTRTFSAFFYPTNGGAGTMTFASAAGNNKGAIGNANCTVALGAKPRQCQMIVNTLPGFSNYYIRVMSLYDNADMDLRAPNLAGNDLRLTGSQAIIDVTGKAVDVLRRIQVRKPVGNLGLVPDFGLQAAEGLCKRYQVIQGQDAFLPPTDGAIDDPDNICASLSPPTGPAPAAGTAAADVCPPAGCAPLGTGATGKYGYFVTLYNKSLDPVGISIIGCTWDFGDGTPIVSRLAANCHFGDSVVHQYPPIDEVANPWPTACLFNTTAAPPRDKYTATLVQSFSNGTKATTTVNTGVPNCP